MHPAVPVLILHPLLTVVTGFGRDASDTVVECLGRLGAPLGPSVTGTVELGGRILELPGALSDPNSRPEVVRSPMIVGELGRRRAATAAADMSQRAARVSRREAGLARRDQLVDRLDRLSGRADELEQQLSPVGDIDDEIEALVRAAQAPEASEPNPIAAALTDEWEALVVERKSTSSGPTVERAEANVEAVRSRIAERRLSQAGGSESQVLSAEGVARVQECHNAVERIAASMEEGKRSERKAAGQKVAAALDAERDALGELGFDSYAAFLLAMAEGRAEGDGAHDLAALQTAEAALVRAREREASFVELSERELDLRARVARLLGRLPGPDVGGELRTGRDTAAAASVALERLANVLRNAGAPVGDDPMAAAERWLSDAEQRRGQRSALMAELAEIESEGSRLDEQLEEAENELAVAERELIAGVSGSLAGREAPLAIGSVEPDELATTFATLVAPEGPPIVVGECFTEITPQACAALLEVIAAVSRRRQIVIVTEHAEVARWAQTLGVEGAVWTPAEAEGAQRALRSERTMADFETDEAQTDRVEIDTAIDADLVEVEVAEAEIVEVEVAEVEVAEVEVAEVDVEVPEVEVPEVEVPEVVEPATRKPSAVLFDFEADESADDEIDEDDFFAAARARRDAAEREIEALGIELETDEAIEAVPVETLPAGATASDEVEWPAVRRSVEIGAADVAAFEAPRFEHRVEPPVEKAPVAKAPPKKSRKDKAAEQAAAEKVEPSRAAGPWKAPRRGRRKKDVGPPAQPWDGKFDTSRVRSMPTSVAKSAVAPPEGSDPLAVCVRHRGVLTRTRCARCGMPACDECMITPKGRRRNMCIECAIIESGVRKRRRNG